MVMGQNVPLPELPRIKAVCIHDRERNCGLGNEIGWYQSIHMLEMRSQVGTVQDHLILLARFDAH